MAWKNSKIVWLLVAATIVAVLFGPLSGVITSGTGDQSVTNESITASTSDYVQLDGYHVADGSETVYWYNDSTNSYETVDAGTDYEVANDPGAVQAIEGGTISDGDDLRVTYTYAATDGTTERVTDLIPLLLVVLILVTLAGPIMKGGLP